MQETGRIHTKSRTKRAEAACLQPGAVHDLVVDSKLLAGVVDDEDADGTTAVVEALGDPVEEVVLVEDSKTLLDLAGLGHGDDATVLADIKNAVLLEHGSVHVLNHDRGGRVRNEGRLLMELLGEEIDTKIAMLTGLGGGGDPDHLARTTLKDEEIADPNVVARNSNRGVAAGHLAGGNGPEGLGGGQRSDGRTGRDDGTGSRSDRSNGGGGGNEITFLEDNSIALRGHGSGVMLTVVVLERMSDTVGSALKSSTEGVIVTLVVVIAHALVLRDGLGRESSY